VKITDIRIHRASRDLSPAFLANWDPQPRRSVEMALVCVETSDGVVGYGSGDSMVGFEPYAELFLGQPLMAVDNHVRILETLTFHAGRYWPVEAAIWDAIGKTLNVPVASLLGGAAESLPAYASTGARMDPHARAEMCQGLRDEGFTAVKLRVPQEDLAEGIATVHAVRDAVGAEMQIMVDLNQSWRMAGDLRTRLDATAVRRFLDACHEAQIFWLEEPLPLTDRVGLNSLRGTGTRVAGGEMVRTFEELLWLVDDDVLDIYQPDVVLSAGMLRMRALSDILRSRGRRFTPHTWSNGIGLLANLHTAAGVGAGPYFEFPYDPPGWSLDRRDFGLSEPIRTDGAGMVHLPEATGLGIDLDFEVFPQERNRT